MNEDDDYIQINTGPLTLDDLTVTIPPTQDIGLNSGTLTITMPDEEVFVTKPDFESKKIKRELGIDLVQEIKKCFD